MYAKDIWVTVRIDRLDKLTSTQRNTLIVALKERFNADTYTEKPYDFCIDNRMTLMQITLTLHNAVTRQNKWATMHQMLLCFIDGFLAAH